ncbi:CsbD family protein [Corynebacterium urealyticum]|uniref:CsbD family protein n=1 Tax=Corynebacterium urealyticum TaxID=43771 RepID=A0A5D4FWF9_9CORY|nr:CsbD family protein [Corynebacterium urealyticum]TYR20417.1 CsbD family protein [Corynebacterium urealyticum]
MSIDDIKGKVKEAFGDATGDESTKAEGKIDQAKSDLQDKANEVKDKAAEAFNDATDK